MYCIVEFLGQEKEIAIISKKWLIDAKTCYWPPFWRKVRTLNAALRNAVEPDPDIWPVFKVHIVGNRFYDTYDEARKYLNPAQDGSEFSEDYNIKKRKRVQLGASHERTSDESDEEIVKYTLPSKRQPKIRCQAISGIPTPPTLTSLVSTSRSSQPKLVAVADTLCQNSESPQTVNQNIESGISGNNYNVWNSTQSGLISDHTHDTSNNTWQDVPFITDKNVSPVSHSGQPHVIGPPGHSQVSYGYGQQQNFQPRQPPMIPPDIFEVNQSHITDKGPHHSQISQLYNNQRLIIAKLDMLLEMVTTVMQGRQVQTSVRGDDPVLKLPICNGNDLHMIEKKVQTEADTRAKLVGILGNVGGNSVNQIVHRTVGSLLTDEVMLLYTFSGQTGKLSFKDTSFLRCICEAVRSNPKGSIAKDKEIESAVEYWLKKASSRIKKRNSRDVVGPEANTTPVTSPVQI